MVLWFGALSFALVMVVFDSAMLDYRLIMIGSVLPWLDFVWGPPWVMHSVAFPVAMMAAVMLLGWGRRLVQRRWLGLAIGVFLHQVLAATWVSRELFWWPAFGAVGVDTQPSVPSPPLAIVLEIVGLGVGFWLVRTLGLLHHERARRFIASGHIDRSSLGRLR